MKKNYLISLSRNFSWTLKSKALFFLCQFAFFAGLKSQGTATDFSHRINESLSRIELRNGRLHANHHSMIPIIPYRLTDQIHALVIDSIDRAPLNETCDWELLLRSNALHLVHDPTQEDRWNALKRKKPIWKYFYHLPSEFYSYHADKFYFSVNPLLDIHLGKQSDSTAFLFQNTRGIQVTGAIDQRVYFSTRILETQTSLPNYVDTYIDQHRAIPGAAYIKKYESGIFKIRNGFDYLLADAVMNIRASKHIDVSMGHGTHFIGSGVRSLLLSDFATPYFYLRLNTTFWKVNYQNIYAELSPDSKFITDPDRLLPKKYMTAHYLSINLLKNWNVGVFESVIFARQNQFELNYLNPIILYRSIEQAIGSPDNVLLGLHSNFNIRRNLSLYGQLALDEFVLKELITDNRGWWANKYGIQVGLKYIDAFTIKNLDIQLEHNYVRPYTYTFRDTIPANYSHYHQELAHPLGANFRENLLVIKYRFDQKITADCNVMLYTKGLDDINKNYGGNILVPYDKNRVGDYGNFIGQGIKTDIKQITARIHYELWPALYLNASMQYRINETAGFQTKNATYLTAGLRWNMDYRVVGL